MGASPRFRFPACLAVFAALAACVPRAPPPAPQPAPIPRPAPVPPSAPPPAPAVGWQDGPLAPGDWSYSGAGAIPQAAFAAPGGLLFALRCDAGGQVRILRTGVPGGAITIVTSFGQRLLPGAGNDQAPATLPASDSLFDQIAFSRGRFLVRVAGGADLVLPSWPEPARLVEDCRGQ